MECLVEQDEPLVPVKPKKAHSKHRGDSPIEVTGSDAYEEIGVGLEKVKATSANPDQLGTDIWELSERKPSTV